MSVSAAQDCWIARIASLWEDDDGQWMKGQWFYFPEEVPGGRQPAHHLYEVFPTSHADTNTLDTISGKVSVLSEEDWRMQAQGPGGDSATDESGRPCFFARWLFDPPTRLFRSLPSPWSAATWTGAEADDTHGAAADDIGAGTSSLAARTKRRSGASRAAAGSAGGGGMTTTSPAVVSSAPTAEGGASRTVDKLAQACLQLQLSSVPRSLPCREEERATIMEFLTSSIRSGGAGSALYLSGMPGTGKTATVMEVVRELRQRAHAGHLRPFSFVNINAMRLTHPYQLYTQVYKALTGEHAAASRAAQLLEERFSSRENVGVSVLLVDEIDFLVTRKQSVLYNIFEWPTRRNARLVVIGIANTMDLPERLLPRVHSRLGLKRIVFTPYTRDQIVDIVRARLEGLDAFAEDAVDMAARKVASLSGDVRRALQICRRAAELARRRVAEKGTAAAAADGDNERVTLRDVNAAARELSTTHALEAIMHGSLWEKLFLVALALLVRQFGAEEVSLRHVASRFAALAQTHLKEKPTSQEVRAHDGCFSFPLSILTSYHCSVCGSLSCSCWSGTGSGRSAGRTATGVGGARPERPMAHCQAERPA